jgi:integrase
MRAKGEGAYWQRPNGSWRYRVVVDGRRVDGTGPTRKTAKDAAHEKLSRVGPKAKPGTVEALFQEWAKLNPARIGLRPTTFDQYTSLIRTWVIPTMGDVQLRSLTKRHIRDAMATWTGSASSQRSTYAAFAKLIDYAVAQEFLATNVVRQVTRPASPSTSTREVPPDAFPRLLAAAGEHRWAVAVWLAFAAGLRRGEILGLKWSDVDLKGRTLTISAKGNITRSSAGLVEGPPKTRAGLRQVHVSTPLADALTRHRKAQAEMKMKAPVWVDSDYVLTTHLGGAVEPRALSRAWKGWARTAKMTGLGIHTGRHYASTMMLASGQASVADVAATMGHDPSVLLSTYAAAVADGQRRATDALGDSLAAGVRSGVTSPRTGRQRKATQ